MSTFGTVFKFIITIAVVIAVAVMGFELIEAYWNLTKYEMQCKIDADCGSASRVCQNNMCQLLPGYSCSSSNDCSTFAPICHPTDNYCTNYTDKPRGVQGNPVNPDGSCTAPFIVNGKARLCQATIGSGCVNDRDCSQGICQSGT